MEFHYHRDERLKEASPSVQRAQENSQGRKGLFSRNPSLRLTFLDLGIILFAALILIPLFRWAGSRDEVYTPTLDSFVYEGDLLVSVKVTLNRKEPPEPLPVMSLSLYLDGELQEQTARDTAPSSSRDPRSFRFRIPYGGQKEIQARLAWDDKEHLLVQQIREQEEID